MKLTFDQNQRSADWAMQGSGIFVTGTDTEIGKTYVSRALADCLSGHFTVTYLKPVQTGCVPDESGELSAPDVDFVLSGKAQQVGAYEDHVPYRFLPACSPHLAAAEANSTIHLPRIRAAFSYLAQQADVTIIEGAGGVYVPLAEGIYTLDLMMYLGIPAIVVTSPRLGTLNHTLLTLSAVRARGIDLLGVVFNNHADRPKDFIYRDNLKTIRAFIDPVPVVELDHNEAETDSMREFCDEIRTKL